MEVQANGKSETDGFSFVYVNRWQMDLASNIYTWLDWLNTGGYVGL